MLLFLRALLSCVVQLWCFFWSVLHYIVIDWCTHSGMKGRPIWYAIHWVLGTGSFVLCIVNIYLGMRMWETITKESIRTLNIIFSVQVALITFVYLMQDRWDYLVDQGRGFTKPIAPPPSATLTPISYSMVPTSMEYQMRHYMPA